MYDKVLLLADGNDFRQPALRRALECVADGGEIEVFGVVYEPLLEGYLGNKAIYEPLRRRVVAERLETAKELAHSLESHGVRASAKAVWSHPMHAAVATEVDAGGFNLVVAAPANLHQAGGSAGHGLSHGDWQVVTGSHAPLLLVKSDGSVPYRSIVAAVDPFHTHAKPQELDREILRCAQALGARTGATLAAVHCYLPVEYFGADLSRVAASDPRWPDARIEAVRALCAAADLDPAAAKVVTGAPHAVLTEMQRRGEADVVVMGALARGRVAELILGNTAERVLHYGTGDVLIVPPQRPTA